MVVPGGGPAVLAVGAHLKNSVALSVGRNVFISQHVGDLDTFEAQAAFERVIAAFRCLFATEPAVVACDEHPDYQSTRWASVSGLPMRPVQHHLAHVLSCMTENEVEPPALGVAWDGTGYGPDGTIWGGEGFSVTRAGCRRVASFRPFALPGGDRAVREPRRTALGALYEVYGEATFKREWLAPLADFKASDVVLIWSMIERGVNAPKTSSVGRLFDAAASLAGLRQSVRYEGQAAMELEFSLPAVPDASAYPMDVVRASSRQGPHAPEWEVDWRPAIRALVADVERRVDVSLISSRFHQALVGVIVDLASKAGYERVVLSGGCFQNRFLVEEATRRLAAGGFKPYSHQRVPPNDGGIALGQVAAVKWGMAL